MTTDPSTVPDNDQPLLINLTDTMDDPRFVGPAQMGHIDPEIPPVKFGTKPRGHQHKHKTTPLSRSKRDYPLTLLVRQENLTVFTPRTHATGVDEVDRCTRRFFFKYRLGLVPRGYRQALDMGKAFHMILDGLYKGDSFIKASETGLRHYEALADALTADTDPSGMLPDGSNLSIMLQQLEIDWLKARAMAHACWHRHPLDLDRFSVVASEQMFDIRIQEPYLSNPIRSTIDLIVEDRETGECWLVDHKTTGYSAVQRTAIFSYDTQSQIYRIVAHAAYPDRNIVGMVHNVVRKPTIKYCGKDASVEAYIDRVDRWYQDQADQKPEDPPLVQSWVRYGDTPLITRELVYRMRRANKACRGVLDHQAYCRAPSACFDYNRLCPFHEMCTSALGAWPEIIQRKFRQEDPDAPRS